MPQREARLNYPGGVFHAISRCVNGEFLMDGRGPRDYYLDLLGRVLERTDAQVLAWCLMSNHVHLVIVQGAEPLERVFKPLHTGFARHVNAHQERRGPVFAGRPRTILVDRDAWLLELVRYVHNNPVRAGVSRYARTSSWSSHQAYIGRVEAPPWLRTGYVLEAFGRQAASMRRKFDAFVDEGRKGGRSALLAGESGPDAHTEVQRHIGDAWRPHGGIVGDEAFVEKVRRDRAEVERTVEGGQLSQRADRPGQPPRVSEVVDAVLGVLDLEPWVFEAQPKRRNPALARQLLVWCWVRRFGGRQADVARELGVASALVSRWYGRAVEDAPSIEVLADVVTQQVRARQRSRMGPPPAGPAVRYDVVVED